MGSHCDQIDDTRPCLRVQRLEDDWGKADKKIEELELERLNYRERLGNLEFIVKRILRKNPELVRLALMED